MGDYKYEFGDTEQLIEETFGSDVQIINPARVLGELPKMEYEEYMKICMLLLSMCDTIYMIDGWRQSNGANREYGYAMAKGMAIIRGGDA